MIKYKTREEIEIMRESAQLVSKTLGMLAPHIVPGAIPLKLDRMAEEFIRDHGGEPGFLGMYGFPNSLCMSPNAQVVHGIPGNTPMKNGDILSVDCGVFMNGYYGDHAYTFAVGEVDQATADLLEATKASLYAGIREVTVGNRLGDVGAAIQEYTESRGYGVVRELVGHGLGEKMHEEPQVANYGKRGRGKKIQEGLVIALEPMINLGTHRIKQLPDGWTILTADGKNSAHFEHDVAVVDGKPDVLSTFQYIYDALGIEPAEYEKI